jgi:hypothetical protein
MGGRGANAGVFVFDRFDELWNRILGALRSLAQGHDGHRSHFAFGIFGDLEESGRRRSGFRADLSEHVCGLLPRRRIWTF